MGDLLGEALSRDAIVKLPKRLRQLDDILQAKGIDLAALEAATVRKVGFWQAMHKDDTTGEAIITDLARIELAPSWESGPAWPPIQPAPAPKAKAKARRKVAGKGWRDAYLVPDMQIGYFENSDGDLEPIHDEAAMGVALAIARDLQPAVVVFHGDNADFAEMSRFRLSPAFQRTTQATIDRCAQVAAEYREACPNAELVWLEGNHEARLPYYILDNARAAFGLRRGHEVDGWPVLSMPHLCHFDDHGVRYESGYPANEWWLNDNFRVIHGHRHKSKGSTAHLYLDDARVSTAFGHIHRRELAQQTRHTRNGPRTVTAVSFGCLCRLDGVVPSTKGGTDVKGQPVRTTEDWQNGVGIVRFQPGDGLHVVEHIEILSGWAMWRDKEYRA
jgi:hypothetical protein